MASSITGAQTSAAGALLREGPIAGNPPPIRHARLWSDLSNVKAIMPSNDVKALYRLWTMQDQSLGCRLSKKKAEKLNQID